MIRSGARSIGFYAFLFWVALSPAAFAKENPCLATLNWDAVSMLDPVTKWAREKGKRWSQRHPPETHVGLGLGSNHLCTGGPGAGSQESAGGRGAWVGRGERAASPGSR